MRYPLGFTLAQAGHRRKMNKAKRTRYRRYSCWSRFTPATWRALAARWSVLGKLADRMSLEQCFKAVDDCGAPIVNVCGGEPTLYPELKGLIEGLIERDKHILMCTKRAAARRPRSTESFHH